MKISYGPPGQRGVTTLMAVGADDIEESPTDHNITIGLGLGSAVSVLGFLVGSSTLRCLGLGAVAALYAVRWKSQQPQVVAVTQPAMQPLPTLTRPL